MMTHDRRPYALLDVLNSHSRRMAAAPSPPGHSCHLLPRLTFNSDHEHLFASPFR